MYYPYSENKGADQLCSYCAADLRLCFRICKIRFSHDAAQLMYDFECCQTRTAENQFLRLSHKGRKSVARIICGSLTFVARQP